MVDEQMKLVCERIISVGAKTTESSNYIIGYDDVNDLISEKDFVKDLEDITENLLTVYGEIVADVDISEDNELDCIFYLDYCPHYVWLEEEREEMEAAHGCTEEEWDAHWESVPDSYWQVQSCYEWNCETCCYESKKW